MEEDLVSSLIRRFISQMRTFRRDERGDMAEAAITTPVIILLMGVILNFGMLAYTAQAAENAANYGARRGSVAQSNASGRGRLCCRLCGQPGADR